MATNLNSNSNLMQKDGSSSSSSSSPPVRISGLRKRLVEQGSRGMVRVNQRSLVDKLLGRYKGELTAFREVVQNSDDAGATKVVIVINSKEQLIRISNNGRVFLPEDWERLQSIADGNPDEQTTGMFGVGFYSVFSLTESPIVRSGSTALLFEWQGNQLATSQLDLNATMTSTSSSSSSSSSQDGTVAEREDQQEGDDEIMRRLREDGELEWTDIFLEGVKPSICSSLLNSDRLARYLAEMLPFARYLQRIEIHHQHPETSSSSSSSSSLSSSNDSIPPSSSSSSSSSSAKRKPLKVGLLYDIKKTTVPHPLLSFQKRFKSPQSFFEASAVSSQRLKIEFSSRTTPPSVPSSDASPVQTPPSPFPSSLPSSSSGDFDDVIWMTLVETVLTSKLDATTLVGVANVLKKNPPSRTRVALIYQGAQDLKESARISTSSSSPSSTRDPNELRRFSSRKGNIFVGFPTGQDTGCPIDIAAQLYPTMEREHIDFNGDVGSWNKDLLAMCGALLRSVYDYLIPQGGQVQGGSSGGGKKGGKKNNFPTSRPIPPTLDEQLGFASLLRFEMSSPSSDVSQILSSSFFEDQVGKGRGIVVPTSNGKFVASSSVRVPFLDFDKFVSLPLLHPLLIDSRPLSAKERKKTSSKYRPSFGRCLLDRRLTGFLGVLDLISELKAKALPDQDRVIDLLKSLIQWHLAGNVSREEVASILRACRWSTIRMSDIKFFVSSEMVFTTTETNKAKKETSGATEDDRLASSSSEDEIDEEREEQEEIIESLLSSHKETLPLSISRHFAPSHLENVLHLTRLPSAKLCEFATKAKLYKSKFAATFLLSLISRHFSISVQDTVVNNLSNFPCIPTEEKEALQSAENVYLPTVKSVASGLLHVSQQLFDLVPRKFLTTLGIRETISTRLLLDLLRSQDEAKRRDIKSIIDHIVENSSRLQEDDWTYLQGTKFLPCVTLVEQKSGEKNFVKGFNTAENLVFPDEKLLSLGFSVLDWESSVQSAIPPAAAIPTTTTVAVPSTTSSSISSSGSSDPSGPIPTPTPASSILSAAQSITKLQRNVLSRIGVQNHPVLKSLLTIASKSNDLQVVIKANLYFLEHYDKTYKTTYQKQGFATHLPFIPVLSPSTSSASSTPVVPKKTSAECYLAPPMSDGLTKYLSLKGLVIPELAGLLKEKQLIEGHPPLREVLETLQLKGIPVELAKEMFASFMLKYMNKMTDRDWKTLTDSAFIPIVLGEDGTTPIMSGNITTAKTKWMKPSELVFFNESLKKDFDNLLDYVPMDYGKLFLQGCGIISYPGDEAFARALLRNYRRFFAKADNLLRYRGALRKLASIWSSLSEITRNKILDTPLFLGIRGQTQVELAKVKSCLLVDNQVYCDMFNPLTCPADTELETFYLQLGSKWITQVVTTKFVADGNPRATRNSGVIQELLLERRALLVYDPDTRMKKPDLKLDHSLILERMKVLEVDRITKVLSFDGITKNFPQCVGLLSIPTPSGRERRNSSSVSSASSASSTTIIVSKPQEFSEVDYSSSVLHGISRVLTTLLFTRFKHSEASNIFFVLKNSLENLEAEGYPVTALRKKTGEKEKEKEVKPVSKQDWESEEGMSGTGAAGGSGGGGGAPSATDEWERLLKQAVKRTPNSHVLPKTIEEVGGTFPVHACETHSDLNLQVASGWERDIGGFRIYESSIEEDAKMGIALVPIAQRFGNILRILGTKVFGMEQIEASIALYLNIQHRSKSADGSIAFNKGGKLFFNLLYYQDVYESKLRTSNTTGGSGGSGKSMEEIWYAWYITFCHELAHNLEGGHNQLHESIMGMLQEKYYTTFVATLATTLLPTASSSSSSSIGNNATSTAGWWWTRR